MENKFNLENYELENYEPVSERIKKFYTKYPDGRIYTNIEKLEGDLVIVKAWLYKNAEEQEKGLFLSTGYAYEREGKGIVNATSYIENAETSACGRALSNIGMHGDLRPSREEMEKVARMTPDASKTHKNTPNFGDNAKKGHDKDYPEKSQNRAVSGVCEFGKDKGRKWSDMETDRLAWYIDYYESKVAQGGKFVQPNTYTLNMLKRLYSERAITDPITNTYRG